MTYAQPNFTDPAQFITYGPTVTSGLFFDLILIGIFIVTFGTLSGRTTTERAFAVAAFFNGVLSMFLFIIGGIEITAALISVSLAIVGFILLLFNKD
jgi:hypothetical protein